MKTHPSIEWTDVGNILLCDSIPSESQYFFLEINLNFKVEINFKISYADLYPPGNLSGIRLPGMKNIRNE